MKRVIYVPTVAELERAEFIAKSVKLPIQIGDSSTTEFLEFDRSAVQILSIPSIQEVNFLSPVFSQLTFICDITDEWLNFLKSTVSFFATNLQTNETFEFKPKIKELHYVRFCPRLDTPGTYQTSVVFDNEPLFEQEIDVL